MKNGDFYTHYKGGEYWFDCLALPLKDRNLSTRVFNQTIITGTARYHENTHDLNLYLYDGITFIDYDLPCVIYQAEKDHDTEFVWAREIDDFFGYKIKDDGSYIKRFALKMRGQQ